MNILLVSATSFEVEPLLTKLKAENAAIPSIKRCIAGQNKIDILITGVGMVATAFHLGKILPGSYDLVINMGLAGSFKPSLKIGEVVNVVEDVFAELGAEDHETFLTPSQMGLAGVEIHYQNKRDSGFKILDGFKKVKGITVNTVHGNDQSIAKIVERYHPDIESMEGAAFLFACLSSQVNCIQIRAISNYVEKRDKSKWNIPLAIEQLNKVVLEIIQ